MSTHTMFPFSVFRFPISVSRFLVLSLRMTDIGGRQVGPYRVWLGEAQLLGLAMSRSLGDTLAHSVGVSPKPEVRNAAHCFFRVGVGSGVSLL